MIYILKEFCTAKDKDRLTLSPQILEAVAETDPKLKGKPIEEVIAALEDTFDLTIETLPSVLERKK